MAQCGTLPDIFIALQIALTAAKGEILSQSVALLGFGARRLLTSSH